MPLLTTRTSQDEVVPVAQRSRRCFDCFHWQWHTRVQLYHDHRRFRLAWYNHRHQFCH